MLVMMLNYCETGTREDNEALMSLRAVVPEYQPGFPLWGIDKEKNIW